jgi:hypothetical protein
MKLFIAPTRLQPNTDAVAKVLADILGERTLIFSLVWTPGHRVFLLGIEARKYIKDEDKAEEGWVRYLQNPVVEEDGEITVTLSQGLKIDAGEKYEIRFLAIAPKPVPKAIAALTDAGVTVQLAPKPPKVQELKGNTPWPFQGTYTARKEKTL